MIGLTAKQRRLLDFITAEVQRSGVAPTYKEMCAELGLTSRSSVSRLVESLEARGHIRHIPHRARAIELVPQGDAISLHPEVRAAAVAFAKRERISLSAALSEAVRAYFCGDKAA